MQETVKQLRQDEGELENKIERRRQELEMMDKRLKGIENVKPEQQEEQERLEAELERFYTIYVEKYTNIDYLEDELDLYNLKDVQRRHQQESVIDKLKKNHYEALKDEIFEDHDEGDRHDAARFDQMRETKTGFGGKARGANNYAAEGGLEGPEQEEDSEEDDDDVEGVEDVEGEEDIEDDQSDHNF